MTKRRIFVLVGLFVGLTFSPLPTSQITANAEAKAAPAAAAAQENVEQIETTLALADEVRHQILMLPFYGVFDWITGSVAHDGTVSLVGYVVRPVTKSDIEARVKKLEHVTKVVNNIEVLPLSPNDRRIRIAIYRALFGGGSPLFKYATMAVPSIHIVVNRGHAILEGVVDNQSDKNYADIKAKGVPGVFSVKNNLHVPGNR